MGENSKISWTTHTFNPWIGCTRVSPGCQHCYAEAYDKRVGGRPKNQRVDPNVPELRWGPKAPRVRTSVANWRQPLAWNEAARAAGERHRVFCSSLADVFEDRPELVEWRVELFEIIRRTQNLSWLLLTKRPENIVPQLRTAFEFVQKEIANGRASSKRVDGVRGSEDRRVGDRRRGSNLEAKEAHLRSMDGQREGDAMQASACGDSERLWVPAAARDAQPETGVRGSAPRNLASPPRPDPSGEDREPPRRREEQQSHLEPRVGHVQRTTGPCDSVSWSQAPRRAGGEKPEDKAHGRDGAGDSPPPDNGRDGEEHRREFRNEAAGDQCDLHPPQLVAHRLTALLEWLKSWLDGQPPANVWLGTTVEDQQRANERIPALLSVPARVRFLSCEPLLERVDLNPWLDKDATGFVRGIHWVIVGGESGPGARPFGLDWARAIVRQCRDAGGEVAPFVKQLGSCPESGNPDDKRHCGNAMLPSPFRLVLQDRAGGDISEWPQDLQVREFPEVLAQPRETTTE